VISQTGEPIADNPLMRALATPSLYWTRASVLRERVAIANRYPVGAPKLGSSESRRSAKGMRYSGHTDCSPKTLAAAQLQSKEYSLHASSRTTSPQSAARTPKII
jgi:hypothetical protein